MPRDRTVCSQSKSQEAEVRETGDSSGPQMGSQDREVKASKDAWYTPFSKSFLSLGWQGVCADTVPLATTYFNASFRQVIREGLCRQCHPPL